MLLLLLVLECAFLCPERSHGRAGLQRKAGECPTNRDSLTARHTGLGLGSGSSRRQIHAIRDLRVAWYQGSPTVDGRTMLAHARVALVLVRARGGRGGRAPYAKCQGALPLSNVGRGGSVGQTRSQHHEAIAIQRVSATTWCFGQMRK